MSSVQSIQQAVSYEQLYYEFTKLMKLLKVSITKLVISATCAVIVYHVALLLVKFIYDLHVLAFTLLEDQHNWASIGGAVIIKLTINEIIYRLNIKFTTHNPNAIAYFIISSAMIVYKINPITIVLIDINLQFKNIYILNGIAAIIYLYNGNILVPWILLECNM